MPFQVSACGGSYLQPNVADVTVTTLLFDNGVRAHIHVSWLHPFKEQRLVVIGDRAMATFDDVAKTLTVYRHRVEDRDGQSVPVPADGESIEYPPDEPLRRECQAFLAAVTTRRPPITDAASGLRTLKVLQAAQRSLVTNGEPVSLPIETFNGVEAGIAW
jgi:predicted dehydrogenase